MSEQEVPEVHARSRRSRSCWPWRARRRVVKEVCREHAISESLLQEVARAAARGRPRALAGKEERTRATSCAARSPSSSGRSAARPMSWRSRENSCGSGSETGASPAPVNSSLEGHRPSMVARVAGDQPPGALPAPTAAAAGRQRRPPARSDRAAIVEVARATRPTATGWSRRSRARAARAARSTASGCCGVMRERS